MSVGESRGVVASEKFHHSQSVGFLRLSTLGYFRTVHVKSPRTVQGCIAKTICLGENVRYREKKCSPLAKLIGRNARHEKDPYDGGKPGPTALRIKNHISIVRVTLLDLLSRAVSFLFILCM
jgi:hypothetical protein